ncbi:MAG: superoxide dismutase family protein [Caldilineaceae bacterium]
MLADDLSGLPGATVITAEIDPLRSEGEAYAVRLQEAGVDVTYQNFAGVTHEFFGMGAVLPAARDAVDLAGQDLRAAFSMTGTTGMTDTTGMTETRGMTGTTGITDSMGMTGTTGMTETMPDMMAMAPANAILATDEVTPTGEAGAMANLLDADGNAVGQVLLTPVTVGSDGTDALLIQVQVEGLSAATAGEHGFHIHAVGQCEAPTFEAAGGHFNPTDTAHGFLHTEGSHAGDLPNLIFADDGSANAQWATTLVALQEGETTLLDDDGAAIVIHADGDDYISQPSGKSGNRLACGVIAMSQ